MTQRASQGDPGRVPIPPATDSARRSRAPSTRVSIVVVADNHRGYLADCVAAIERARIPPGAARLILVDNASQDGTADFVRRELFAADGTHTRGGFPALFVASPENLGFSGGNNLAIRRAMEDGDEFVYLLNPDTEAAPDFLERALEAARADPTIAEVQSLLIRHSVDLGTDVVNTWGNALHFLGFGYVAGDGVALDEA